MKSFNATVRNALLLPLFCLLASPALAQLELPAPSPKASVEQTVGLTDIRIEYSSPGVKGRTIWGDLVPYDKMWRTGANKATSFSFSKDVYINGDTLPAGDYSFFTIPGKEEWTLIFNNETELWGTGGYDQTQDALRITAKPKNIPHRERMTFIVSDFDYEKARINLEWEKVRVSFTVQIETDAQALSNIQRTISQIPGQYANAARYTIRVEKHYDQGIEWIDKALAINDDVWYYHWVKAEILGAQGKYQQAHKVMQKAYELGEVADRFFYKSRVEARLAEWKEKL